MVPGSWHQAESSPPLALRRAGALRFSSVTRPLPGTNAGKFPPFRRHHSNVSVPVQMGQIEMVTKVERIKGGGALPHLGTPKAG